MKKLPASQEQHYHHKSFWGTSLPTQHPDPTAALTKLEVSVQDALEVKVFQA